MKKITLKSLIKEDENIKVGDDILVYSKTQNHPIDRGEVTKIDKKHIYVDGSAWEKNKYDFIKR